MPSPAVHVVLVPPLHPKLAMVNIALQRTIRFLAIAAILVGTLALVADARVFKGSMNTKHNWQYFSRFCFLGNQQTNPQGQVKWNVGNTHSSNTQLLSYWDQPDVQKSGSWVAVYQNNNLNCQQKADKAGHRNNVSLDHTSAFYPPNGYNHFWWFVFADCSGGSQTIDYYEITFLQKDGNQLSCDEIGTFVTGSLGTRAQPSPH